MIEELVLIIISGLKAAIEKVGNNYFKNTIFDEYFNEISLLLSAIVTGFTLFINFRNIKRPTSMDVSISPVSNFTFDVAFQNLMQIEKGYVEDIGGKTRYGITENVARANGYDGDMRDLPLDTARQIAKKCYWDKYQCGKFNPIVAYHVFDTAYNGGHVVQWLQLASGCGVDGVLGPITIAAVNSKEPYEIISKFNSYRLQYMTECKGWTTYAKGWARRIANNLLK